MPEAGSGWLSLPSTVVAMLAVLCAVLLLWRGTRLLLWPFRALGRSVKASAPDVHPAAIAVALVAAVVIVPGPFNYLLEVFVSLVHLVAFELPSAIFGGAQAVLSGCANAPQDQTKCASEVLAVVGAVWSGPLRVWFGNLKVPPMWDWAVLVFAVGLGAIWAVTWWLNPLQRAGAAGDSVFYKTAALVVSLAGSLYLCITAIVAIPVFSDRPANIDESRNALVREMQGQPDQYLAQAKRAPLPPDSVVMPDVAPLRTQIQALWAHQDNEPDLAATKAGELSQRQLREFYRDFLLGSLDDVASQISAWTRTAEELQRSADSFGDRASKFAKRVSEHFTEENTGRIGGVLTQQHAAILAASYNLWLSAYADGLEACRTALIAGQDVIRARYSAISQDVAIRPTAGPPAATPQTLGATGGDARAGFVAMCANTIPREADYLKERRGASDSLGFFGTAAKWLLATESRDLALITGLLGFGFFGALAASFIRQAAATPGQSLPPPGWIIPALIRGVAAAVLVFLAVVGGLAVFTQAGPEPSPNPYAVFFTCFIAAVFSEDVWLWARRQQSGKMPVEPEHGPTLQEVRASGEPGALVPAPPSLPPPGNAHA